MNFTSFCSLNAARSEQGEEVAVAELRNYEVSQANVSSHLFIDCKWFPLHSNPLCMRVCVCVETNRSILLLLGTSSHKSYLYTRSIQ